MSCPDTKQQNQLILLAFDGVRLAVFFCLLKRFLSASLLSVSYEHVSYPRTKSCV